MLLEKKYYFLFENGLCGGPGSSRVLTPWPPRARQEQPPMPMLPATQACSSAENGAGGGGCRKRQAAALPPGVALCPEGGPGARTQSKGQGARLEPGRGETSLGTTDDTWQIRFRGASPKHLFLHAPRARGATFF